MTAGAARLRADGDTGPANALLNQRSKKYPNGRPVATMASGGIVPRYFAVGGSALNMKGVGTDIIPAMLTPGEFVITKNAVSNIGVDRLRAINSGDSLGDSVYNYSVTVNASSNASPQEIARTVMNQIKDIDSQRIQGVRL